MGSGIKRAAALLLCLTLLPLAGFGELKWRQETKGQQLLKTYVETANRFLAEQGEMPVNSLFEMYRSMAVFGITQEENAETPEGVEITVNLLEDSIDNLQLRVNYLPRFPQIASAFLQALFPDEMTPAEARKGPEALVKRAEKNPENSWEEEVELLGGTIPRAYYAYYPNQYHDGVSWAQMTIVFPLPEFWGEYGLGGDVRETNAPDTYTEGADGYEGYFPEDDFSHLDVYTSPTPEPDSPAGEYDPYDFEY